LFFSSPLPFSAPRLTHPNIAVSTLLLPMQSILQLMLAHTFLVPKLLKVLFDRFHVKNGKVLQGFGPLCELQKIHLHAPTVSLVLQQLPIIMAPPTPALSHQHTSACSMTALSTLSCPVTISVFPAASFLWGTQAIGGVQFASTLAFASRSRAALLFQHVAGIFSHWNSSVLVHWAQRHSFDPFRSQSPHILLLHSPTSVSLSGLAMRLEGLLTFEIPHVSDNSLKNASLPS
jgi:hypothetical protein